MILRLFDNASSNSPYIDVKIKLDLTKSESRWGVAGRYIQQNNGNVVYSKSYNPLYTSINYIKEHEKDNMVLDLVKNSTEKQLIAVNAERGIGFFMHIEPKGIKDSEYICSLSEESLLSFLLKLDTNNEIDSELIRNMEKRLDSYTYFREYKKWRKFLEAKSLYDGAFDCDIEDVVICNENNELLLYQLLHRGQDVRNTCLDLRWVTDIIPGALDDMKGTVGLNTIVDRSFKGSASSVAVSPFHTPIMDTKDFRGFELADKIVYRARTADIFNFARFDFRIERHNVSCIAHMLRLRNNDDRAKSNDVITYDGTNKISLVEHIGNTHLIKKSDVYVDYQEIIGINGTNFTRTYRNSDKGRFKESLMDNEMDAILSFGLIDKKDTNSRNQIDKILCEMMYEHLL